MHRRSPSLLLPVLLTATSFLLSLAFSPPPPSHISTSLHATSTDTPKLKPFTITGPPLSTKPDYTSIHGPLGPIIDDFLLSLFRRKLASRLSTPLSETEIAIPDSSITDDYSAIISLTHKMNLQYSNRTTVQLLAQEVLVSLFPKFILDRFPLWFARPFPDFSANMCAYATVAFGTWLMGECDVNDVPPSTTTTTTSDATVGVGKGVLVQRCRFLQESQCASICINSCKIPTQNFFSQNMGLALTMTPNYDTFECQFAFGQMPNEEAERKARETPCLGGCPSGGGMRSWHDGGAIDSGKKEWLLDLERLVEVEREKVASGGNCGLMEDFA